MTTQPIARQRYWPARRVYVLGASLVRRVMFDGEINRVRLGRLLVTAEGVFAVSVSPALGLNVHAVHGLLLVSAGMAVLLAASYAVPWRRLPTPATTVFAVAVIGALAALGAIAPVVFTPLSSFITLSFVYVGVTQRARVALALAPLAAVTLAVNYGDLTAPVAIRVSIATAVWLLTACVLASLTASSAAVSAAFRRAAAIDQLTDIPNRRDLDARLAELNGNETIVVLDLDHFKRINDTLGHAAGDAVLTQFGALLRDGLRQHDYCARFGGEEFVLILPPSTTGDGHQVLLARLRSRWARLVPGVTFSSGAASSHPDRTSQATLARADQALYAAKNAGRNTDLDYTDLHTADVGVSELREAG